MDLQRTARSQYLQENPHQVAQTHLENQKTFSVQPPLHIRVARVPDAEPWSALAALSHMRVARAHEPWSALAAPSQC